MGADGTWQLVTRGAWDVNCPGIEPRDCGYSTPTILGMRAVSYYSDTEGRGDEFGGLWSVSERVDAYRNWLFRVFNEGDSHTLTLLDQFGKPWLPKDCCNKVPSPSNPRRCTVTVYAEPLRRALDEAMADKDKFEKSCLAHAAREWFAVNAESHTVWT